MTDRLYWDDAYLREAECRVVETSERGVVLDATIFHPRGGGQPGDIGLIGDDRIVDTRVEGDRIVHLTEGAPTSIGGTAANVRIDWARRYGLMRHHSLLHLVHLGVARMSPGARALGSDVGSDRARIEYAGAEDVDLETLLDFVVDLVALDPPVTTAGDAGVRTWSLPGHPGIPCGGTHVRRLGEIGDVVLRRKSAGRRGIRLYASSHVDPVGALTAS